MAKKNVTSVVAHLWPRVGDVESTEEDRVIAGQVVALTAERDAAQKCSNHALKRAISLTNNREVGKLATNLGEQSV